MPDFQNGLTTPPTRSAYMDASTGQPQQLMGNMPEPTQLRTSNYNKMKPIQINQIDHGFIVVVGCQTLAIETKQQLISRFIEYVNAPAETEAKHLEGRLF